MMFGFWGGPRPHSPLLDPLPIRSWKGKIHRVLYAQHRRPCWMNQDGGLFFCLVLMRIMPHRTRTKWENEGKLLERKLVPPSFSQSRGFLMNTCMQCKTQIRRGGFCRDSFLPGPVGQETNKIKQGKTSKPGWVCPRWQPCVDRRVMADKALKQVRIPWRKICCGQWNANTMSRQAKTQSTKNTCLTDKTCRFRKHARKNNHWGLMKSLHLWLGRRCTKKKLEELTSIHFLYTEVPQNAANEGQKGQNAPQNLQFEMSTLSVPQEVSACH